MLFHLVLTVLNSTKLLQSIYYPIPSRVTQFDGEIPRSQFMLIIVLIPFNCCNGKWQSKQ